MKRKDPLQAATDLVDMMRAGAEIENYCAECRRDWISGPQPGSLESSCKRIYRYCSSTTCGNTSATNPWKGVRT